MRSRGPGSSLVLEDRWRGDADPALGARISLGPGVGASGLVLGVMARGGGKGFA